MAARFSLTRYDDRGQATKRGFVLTDSKSGKRWSAQRSEPASPETGLTDLATLFETALADLAPTA